MEEIKNRLLERFKLLEGIDLIMKKASIVITTLMIFSIFIQSNLLEFFIFVACVAAMTIEYLNYLVKMENQIPDTDKVYSWAFCSFMWLIIILV